MACTAAMAGCGGDGGGSDVTEGEWSAQVNGICRSNRAEVQDLARTVRAEGFRGKRAVAELIERSIPFERDLIGELRKVEAPDDIEPEYRRFVDRIASALPLFKRFVANVRSGRNDPELTTEFAKIAADTRPFAHEHNLISCLPDAQ